ncbi:iron-sulfur cluster biosynthesis family protein [Pontibacillus yanchengensis]|uniref:Iron-sulfur cluster biosynthesis family protein n=2 Tax=Pontibacillus yanchengensis TaxID=462910 RepID=A0ACC7VLI9_9BACI|nr:iron-sulfur cluster biosynthesis family protein [Pontibacillus yanchengensis]MYL55049.1 iron-sulfur cluster biosynthesis family protein [Pontibacillus yanchengensis]
MKLHITDEAKKQLQQLQPVNHSMLRLYYDTDGCGCGVDGMPILHFTDQQTVYDEEVENDNYTVIIDDQQKLFFDESMTLEWNGQLFRLKSPKGMLNASISSTDIEKGGALVEQDE